MDINGAFKSVCKVLLKEEVGELDEFEKYLSKYAEKLHVAQSAAGALVYYTAPYCEGARFVSFEEAFKPGASQPVDVNDTKDIDSLLNAVGERVCYAGNKVLGNSKFVQESENIIDSSVVYRSSEVLRCEYVAYSSLPRDSKYLFGFSSGADNSFCVKCAGTNQSHRCLESNLAYYCADAYFSNNCKNCQDILFCFDQHSQSSMVGNNKLEKQKYAELKKHILSQVVDELKAKKTVPSLVDFVAHGDKP